MPSFHIVARCNCLKTLPIVSAYCHWFYRSGILMRLYSFNLTS
uniref:Uncharacterized protein n=1 Tax=Arundo donax TaxID=35708 RepID=A0A0A8ZPQ2_ARUDO